VEGVERRGCRDAGRRERGEQIRWPRKVIPEEDGREAMRGRW
jgi:hypothetical protein